MSIFFSWTFESHLMAAVNLAQSQFWNIYLIIYSTHLITSVCSCSYQQGRHVSTVIITARSVHNNVPPIQIQIMISVTQHNTRPQQGDEWDHLERSDVSVLKPYESHTLFYPGYLNSIMLWNIFQYQQRIPICLHWFLIIDNCIKIKSELDVLM